MFARLNKCRQRFVDGSQIATESTNFRVRLLVIAIQPELRLSSKRYQMVKAMNAHLQMQN